MERRAANDERTAASKEREEARRARQQNSIRLAETRLQRERMI